MSAYSLVKKCESTPLMVVTNLFLLFFKQKHMFPDHTMNIFKYETFIG